MKVNHANNCNDNTYRSNIIVNNKGLFSNGP